MVIIEAEKNGEGGDGKTIPEGIPSSSSSSSPQSPSTGNDPATEAPRHADLPEHSTTSHLPPTAPPLAAPRTDGPVMKSHVSHSRRSSEVPLPSISSTPLRGSLVEDVEESNSLPAFSPTGRALVPQTKEWYPFFHIAPPTGWMNDPNGCSFFKGVYHVFYQHHPFNEDWGLMYWGHATSTDLIHWEHQPIALSPGDSFDRDGCFSGSAVTFNDKMYAFYTGHQWINQDQENDSIFQQQCLAVSEDGVHFEKLGVVVRPPQGVIHFRDPKVWFSAGKWWMVVGARDSTRDIGEALLYWTTDLEKWDDQHFMILGSSMDKNVFMWECPDFFITEGIAVLIFSPQGMKAKGYDFRNRFQSGYMLGQWEPGKPFQAQTKFRELDHGHDFYAPQTFQSEDGRQLLFAWMGMWESPMPTKAFGWSGLLTIPREVELEERGGEKLIMRPAREMEGLRESWVDIEEQIVEQDSELVLCQECSSHEVIITFNTDCSTAEKYGLWLGKGCELYVDNQSQRIVLFRHYPEHMLSGYRSCPLPDGAVLKLRIFFDSSSIEVFVNDGMEVFTSRVYSEGDNRLRVVAFSGMSWIVGGMVYSLMQRSVYYDRDLGFLSSSSSIVGEGEEGFQDFLE